MISRQFYGIAADTGTQTLTGPPFTGRVLQARWEVTGAADTGGDLAIYLQQRVADTGNGVLIVNDNDVLGTDFVRQFRSPTHNTSGVAIDTGDDFAEPVVSAGEALRVVITPGGAGPVGRLYVWTDG